MGLEGKTGLSPAVGVESLLPPSMLAPCFPVPSWLRPLHQQWAGAGEMPWIEVGTGLVGTCCEGVFCLGELRGLAGKGGWDRKSKDLSLQGSSDVCCPLLPSIPTMLSVHSEQLNKTGFPTVHAVVLLEGTMNLTGETQPLVEQLMMVKRMQVQKWHLILLRGSRGCGTRALLQLPC